MSSQSLTPIRSAKSSTNPRYKTLQSGASSSPSFTARMQDAQARGKEPYESEDSDDAWVGKGKGNRFDAYGNDSYENVQKRRQAAIILDSPELLMMNAQARNDSIAGTRYYFTKMLCGYLNDEEAFPEKERQKTGKGK